MVTRSQDFASALRACLDADDPNRALIALATTPEKLVRVPMVAGGIETLRPHEVVGVAIQMMAGAMVAGGASAEARAFIDTAAGLFDWGHRCYARATDFRDLVEAFPFLWVPSIRASIAQADWDGAVRAILAFRNTTKAAPAGVSPASSEAVSLLSHPAAAAFGPFLYDPSWVLDRQDEVLAGASLDPTLEMTWTFFGLFVETALHLGEAARALPLVEAWSGARVPFGELGAGHFEFDAVCVLGALGRFDEAMERAEQLVRRGYGLRWRFDLDAASKMAWTQEMRQNEWLGALAETPRYQAFLRDEIAYDALDGTDPTRTALCTVREDTLGGKAKKRCWLSRKMIEPGDPVVRVRRLFHCASDGGFDIAAEAAFEASGWAETRRRFVADSIPLACLFPPPRRLHQDWDTPAIAAFHHDVSKEPAAFDLDRAIAIVADHDPRPIRHGWMRGEHDDVEAFEPRVNDRGHGDAVNFTWRLLKAGFAPELLSRIGGLAPTAADKVFAMLAIFDRDDCRRAAAARFDLPRLPTMMAHAAADRPTLEAHLEMAAFAHAAPRWRKALAAAMRAYALHLYSNYRPGADWFLEGLEHLTRARGCQLLNFLIHHPEDDEVLATMLERHWLPSGIGLGAYDAYDNASAFYYRAALFNRAIHAPERLDAWLGTEWMNDYRDSAKDRETRRLAARLRGEAGAMAKRNLDPGGDRA